MSLSAILGNVQHVVEKTGLLASEYFISDNTLNQSKCDGSVVTEVDFAIEKVLVSHIKKNFPEDSIVGEEGGNHESDGPFVWHIDPIDGTDNFLRKIPFCAVSVARLGNRDNDSFAIVYNPITKQMYTATNSAGVHVNGVLKKINSEPLGSRALVSVCKGKEEWMKSATYNLQKAIGIKYGKGASLGCCALECTYVAVNRIDGVLILGLNSFDYAAGLFLIKQAGGSISVFDGRVWYPWESSLKELCGIQNRFILASHDGIHDELIKTVGDVRVWADG